MSSYSPHLWRIACQIHQQLLAAQQNRQQLDLPICYWPEFLKKGCLANLAHARSWKTARTEADADFKRFLADFISKLQTLRQHIQDRENSPAIASSADIYRDLEALGEEFPEIDYDIKLHQLKVTTDPVILEGVELGPFQIILEWNHLGQHKCYHVTAIDPHPAHSDEEMVHPHLNHETLCEGDGAMPIKQALEQGRILDFFILVRQILTTYNPSSAYLALERWYGSPCQSCSALTDDDDYYCCRMCSDGVCRDCSGSCNSCCESCCLGCLKCCPHCDNSFCSHCMSSCTVCCEDACDSCLIDGICPTCELPPEEDDEAPEDTEQPAELTVHPVCLGEVALLA